MRREVSAARRCVTKLRIVSPKLSVYWLTPGTQPGVSGMSKQTNEAVFASASMIRRTASKMFDSVRMPTSLPFETTGSAPILCCFMSCTATSSGA